MTARNIIQGFDIQNKKLDEMIINSALRKIFENYSEVPLEDLAEIMAFNFIEDYRDKKTGWGTYFGPKAVWTNEDGNSYETPSLKLVSPEMVQYWKTRATEAANPILKARYSGLVYDFSKIICNEKPSFEICHLYITSLIDVGNNDLSIQPINTFKKLKRALNLAISLNNSELVEATKKALILYEDTYAEDLKPGLWGYCYELLVDNKKIKLSQEEELKIIQDLEKRLLRLNNYDKIDTWSIENAVIKLALYYSRRKEYNQIHRVINIFANALDSSIKGKEAMQIMYILEKKYNIYLQYNLKDEAAKTLIKIRELGPKLSGSLKSFPFKFSFPDVIVENLKYSILNGNPSDMLGRIADHFIIKINEQRSLLSKRSNDTPLSYLTTQQIQDSKGRIIAIVGPIDKDFEGHLMRQVSKHLQIQAVILQLLISQGIEEDKINKKHIVEYLVQTPTIEKVRFNIIEQALDAYFNNEDVIFIHLIIPQIEEAIRNLVEINNGVVLKSRNGAYNLKTFDELLREDVIVNGLGEDLAYHFRAIFTDQRGWNLRNDVCHGMTSRTTFNKLTADRVLHALLCLGLIRFKEDV